MFKKTIIGLAVAAGAVFGMSGAASAAVTLFVETAPPGINEADLDACVFGNPSLGCEAAYQLYTGARGGTETDREHAYTVAEIRAIVGDTFSIGIDSNTAQGQVNACEFQFLRKFELWNADTNTLLFVTDAPYERDTAGAQGNGFTDFIINGFNLAGLSDDTNVFFRLSMTGLSDGAEQFFFVDAPEEIPLPAAIWLMGAGVAGLGFAGRKKKA